MTEPTLHTQQIQAPSTDQFEKLTAKQQRFHLRLDLSRRALQGESIRVESYLEMYPALEQNSEALLDLLESEISIRTGQGERVELRELQERFPHLGATISGLMAPVSVDPESGTLPPPDPEACCETGTVLPTAKEMIKVSAPVKREIANYDILGELGRGGMGVVYKARQKGLNRLVALKMILHADHAGSDERMRFEREAQAIARLDHPNIVQVHEIGEHEGKPFFSLEFVTGGALDKKLDGKPLPMEESATLVETLARGMHAAHQADVIHRDLKPANVLITEGGVPKITDFGLAKNLDEAGQTQSGAIMGTPSYMAPEQAAGKTQLVGPGVDVYALGAILYECLTGQPPFRAATAMDTVLQVLSQLPVPPSQIREGIPKDLETICLKCLEKEPSKRYETAELLAEDLRRFQNHEPISARPVGRGEKLWRWCKRNPAVASLLTLVVLVLMAGTTVSSILAVKARVEADNARKSQRKATEREKEANQARADLEKTNKELTSSVARSLARPLISEIPLGKPIPLLKDPEREALRELMMTRSEDLRLAFIQESLQTPVKARQLRLRAKEALRAAVGVSPSRLRVAEQSLLKKLKQQTISEEQRADVAIIALHLGPLSSETVQEAVVPVIQVMSRAVDHHELKPLSDSLSALASRMGPKEAARVAAFLLQVISKTTDRRPLHSLSLSLSALASRVEPKEAVAILTQAMGKTHNPSLPRPLPTIPRPLHEGLSAVASRMESKEAAATLIQAMGKVTDSYALRSFSTSLSSIASRLKPEEAAQTAAMLTQAMRKTTESRVLHYLSEGLVSVGIRMEPKGAVTTLTQVLSQTIGSTALRTLSKGLSSLASRMAFEDAAQFCSKEIGTASSTARL